MGKEIAFHVFTTHATSGGDISPMQFVSADQLAYYRRLEAAVGALGGVVLGALLAGAILLVRG
jgi:hypothetical protein